MTDSENDAERFEEEEDASDEEACTCGENEACDECTGETDEEERPISLDLTRGEAILLLHVSWNKKLEMANDDTQSMMAGVMGDIGLQVGREIYSDHMVEWLEERHEEREEMLEEMRDQMGGMFDQAGMDMPDSSGLSFQ